MNRYLILAFTVLVMMLAFVLGDGAKASSHLAAPNLTATPPPSPTVTPPPCSPISSWAMGQPLTTPVGGPAVSGDGSFVYAVDGYDYAAGHTVAQFGKYDPSANAWTYLPNPPNSFYGGAAAYAPNTGKLYVFGGALDDTLPLTTTRVFDFVANSWGTAAPLPAARNGLGAAYSNGKIFLVGGDAGGGTFGNQTWAYDPVADSWMTMTVLPAARVAPTMGAINGHVYAAGGLTDAFAEANSLYDYDVASNTWTSRANMPLGVFGASGIAANGKLYLMGGGFPALDGVNRSAGITAVRNITLIYDRATDSWSSGPALNQGRSFSGAAGVGNYLVVVGGDLTSQSATNSVEVASLVSCSTATPTATTTPAATNTLTAATDTPNPPTNTPNPATDTPLPTDTPTPPPNVTATPTDCANPFVDITGNVFYGAIHYLACRGVVNGIDATHYGPGGTSTRGQFAKVVVLGFGTPFYTPATPDFTDVPATYYAYIYIESGFHAGILSGFDAATCQANGQISPCYLPNLAITRGQLTVLVVNAAHYPLYTPTTPDFTDVPANNVFYVSIETAFHQAVISGYPDHTFRPNNNIRRDEMAQIVYKGVTTP